MAVTQGHGNPKWTREETILALDLYFDCNGHVPSSSDQRVIALSEQLRAFPYHSLAARKKSFRNPDGVGFKLQNLRQVATGKGLGNVSNMDREIWQEFGNDPQQTKTLAELIRAGIELIRENQDDPDEKDTFFEGRIITEIHLRRERNPKLRNKLLAERFKSGGLECDICKCSSKQALSSLKDAIFEAHHILPLAATLERKTELKDMALLCANCHRLIHRAISLKERWVSIEEATALIS
jgi:5-methylcytosine-specific restriction protein A